MRTMKSVSWASVLLGGLLYGSVTRAEDVVIERQVVHQDQDVATTTTETVPNRGLITSGVVLLGATYASSLVVAAGTSDYDPDRKLYIPIAGPWMDLAERKGECGRGNAPSCDNEDLYQVLLVADGIGQGIGALQILGGFVFPVHRTETVSASIVPRLSPKMMGLSAVGTF